MLFLHFVPKRLKPKDLFQNVFVFPHNPQVLQTQVTISKRQNNLFWTFPEQESFFATKHHFGANYPIH